MWFWWFLFVCDLFIPILMIIAGYMMWKHAPEEINGILGYRTSRSMINIDTWRFAQNYCGRLWWKIGWIMLAASFVIPIPFYGSADDMIGMVSAILQAAECAILIATIFPTERALKRNFNM